MPVVLNSFAAARGQPRTMTAIGKTLSGIVRRIPGEERRRNWDRRVRRRKEEEEEEARGVRRRDEEGGRGRGMRLTEH
jgi:hypothetical protein